MNGKAFEGAYVSFDGDTLKWDIGDLFRYEYTLEFPVYLNNTVDLFGEGSNRPTGDYSVSDTSQLTYTDVTSSEVTKDFDYIELSWLNPTEESSTVIDGEDKDPVDKPTDKPISNASTGDNTLQVAGGIGIIAISLLIYKNRYIKARKKSKYIIY